RVDPRRAALEEAVGEPAGGRAEVGRDQPRRIERERVEGAGELHPSARDEGVIGTAHLERCIERELLARLVDAALAGEDLARQDQRLRAGARLHQPALDEQDVRALSLAAHPSARAQNGMSSSPKSSGGKSSAWRPPPPPPRPPP